MPRGSTNSPFGLQERKDLAFQRFAQGYKNAAIARELQVGPDTVARYRTEYETEVGQVARDNPRLLADVVANTIRMLTELDLIKENAWERINQSERIETVVCDLCDGEFEIRFPMSDQNRAQLLRTILSAQDQRAKIYGVFGVKQEYMAMVANVKAVQERLLAFMQRELCAGDRAKLDEFMRTELAEFIGVEGGGHTVEVPAEALRELAAIPE